MKNKIYSECCNAEVYYDKGIYRCGKCNKPVILVLPREGNLGNSQMPKPKRVD